MNVSCVTVENGVEKRREIVESKNLRVDLSLPQPSDSFKDKKSAHYLELKEALDLSI